MDKQIDIKNFRLSRLKEKQYRHILLLLFWPLFILAFIAVERFYHPSEYHMIYSRFDDIIPFCEYFFIPYVLWFLYIVVVSLYSLIYDVPAFKRMMYFIILTFSATIIIYLIYPTVQYLRPEAFVRDNIFTRFMSLFYIIDTNTNVCPSLHVIGSVACTLCVLDSKKLSVILKISSVILCVLISSGTVFLKQHSIIDVFAAIIVSLIGYIAVYIIGEKLSVKGRNKNEKTVL